MKYDLKKESLTGRPKTRESQRFAVRDGVPFYTKVVSARRVVPFRPEGTNNR